MDTTPVATGVPGRAHATAREFEHDFDLADFESRSIVNVFARWAFGYPQTHYLRHALLPALGYLIGHKFITRFDDVQEVLHQHEVFAVPFGPKIERLNGGRLNFLLGMAHGEEYERMHQRVAQAFRREDVPGIVTPRAAEYSKSILDSHRPQCEIDAVQDLITAVPTLICEEYYGVPIPDKVAFGQWTIAMSNYLFGDPTDDKVKQRIGIAGGDRVHAVVTSAVRNAKASGAAQGVMARLLEMQRAEPHSTPPEEKLSDEVIVSFLIGMITGFVPTNTMAAGNMLIMLLQRPDFMDRTCAAVRSGDDDLLKRCLFEAMRFKPLNPGPYRVCMREYAVATGTGRPTRIKRWDKVLAATQYAMFDSKRVHDPHTFNPDRPASDYMVFGYGMHWCIGAYMAQAQITQTFKALLANGPVRASDWCETEFFGMFPAHLKVRFA